MTAPAPARSAGKPAWVAWALRCGGQADEVELLTKSQLVDRYALATPGPRSLLEATRAELDAMQTPAALAAAAEGLARDFDEESSAQARVLLARELRITMTQARALRAERPAGEVPAAAADQVDQIAERRAQREREVAGGR